MEWDDAQRQNRMLCNKNNVSNTRAHTDTNIYIYRQTDRHL